MIISIICYLITTLIIISRLYRRKNVVGEFPYIKLTKKGITFFSLDSHKIFVGYARCLAVDNSVFLKLNNVTISIINVKPMYVEKGELYFKALGRVKIRFNAEKIYKYFNLKIECAKIEVSNLKRKAVLGIVNNLFDYKNNKDFVNYIKLIKNIFKIRINKNGVRVVQPTKIFKYSVIYKLNNNIRKIVVGE